jgi:hypothetical protein
LAGGVQHIFLEPILVHHYRAICTEPTPSPRTGRSTLTGYLDQRMNPGNSDLIEWLLKTAIRLPVALNPGF